MFVFVIFFVSGILKVIAIFGSLGTALYLLWNLVAKGDYKNAFYTFLLIVLVYFIFTKWLPQDKPAKARKKRKKKKRRKRKK